MKKPDFDQNNNSADTDQNPVGVGGRKFRHMRKIHAIPPGDKRQWEKDRGYYGENPHGAVLPTRMGIVEILMELSKAVCLLVKNDTQ